MVSKSLAMTDRTSRLECFAFLGIESTTKKKESEWAFHRIPNGLEMLDSIGAT